MLQHDPIPHRRLDSSLNSRFRSLLTSFSIATLAAVAVIGGSGCQSSRLKDFETVHGGMTKDQVLEVVGGPQRTQRWHGRDRWEYRFYNTSEGDVVREVHFEEGKSTYVGAAIKPAVSAAEQDRLNEEYNRKADSADAEAMAHAKDGVTIQRFHPVDDNGEAGPVRVEPVTGSKPSTSQ